MNFEFATAQRIIFGPGRLRDLPALAETMGTRAALVTGSGSDRIAPVAELLEQNGIRMSGCDLRRGGARGRASCALRVRNVPALNTKAQQAQSGVQGGVLPCKALKLRQKRHRVTGLPVEIPGRARHGILRQR